jgi:Sec-independent protein translocase protein TatA
MELIIIGIIALAIIFFGGGKVQEWAKALARAQGEYEKERLRIKKEIEEMNKAQKPEEKKSEEK